MEDPNSTLLPYILETLSRKPELCDTFENLCWEIQEQLHSEKNTRYGNVRNSIQRALSVGQSLGIITLTNETIRVPFNFRQQKNARAPNPSTAKQPSGQGSTGTNEGNNSQGQSQDKNASGQRSQQNPKATKKPEEEPDQDDQDEEYEYSLLFPSSNRRTTKTTEKPRARSRNTARRSSAGRQRSRSRSVAARRRMRGRSGAMGRRYGRTRR